MLTAVKEPPQRSNNALPNHLPESQGERPQRTDACGLSELQASAPSHLLPGALCLDHQLSAERAPWKGVLPAPAISLRTTSGDEGLPGSPMDSAEETELVMGKVETSSLGPSGTAGRLPGKISQPPICINLSRASESSCCSGTRYKQHNVLQYYTVCCNTMLSDL